MTRTMLLAMVGLLGLALVISARGCGTAIAGEPTTRADSTFRVRSAKRANKFDDHITALTTRDPKKDVILVVELAGISVEDFNATPHSEVYLTAGEERFEPSLRTAGDWADGEEERRVMVIVPRSTLRFSLHFGKRAPLSVTADTAIVETLP